MSLRNDRKSPKAQDALILLHPLSCIENIYKAAVCIPVPTPRYPEASGAYKLDF